MNYSPDFQTTLYFYKSRTIPLLKYSMVNNYFRDLVTLCAISVVQKEDPDFPCFSGTVHAQSTRVFHVDNHLLPYAWNHSVLYTTDQRQPFLIQRLSARNIDVTLLPEQNIVTFTLDASIEPGKIHSIKL